MACDFSASGRLLFGGYDDMNCYAWDTLEEGAPKPAFALMAHANRVSAVGVNRTGQAVATGSWDTELAVSFVCVLVGRANPLRTGIRAPPRARRRGFVRRLLALSVRGAHPFPRPLCCSQVPACCRSGRNGRRPAGNCTKSM
jgi:hypothetical protein